MCTGKWWKGCWRKLAACGLASSRQAASGRVRRLTFLLGFPLSFQSLQHTIHFLLEPIHAPFEVARLCLARLLRFDLGAGLLGLAQAVLRSFQLHGAFF